MLLIFCVCSAQPPQLSSFFSANFYEGHPRDEYTTQTYKCQNFIKAIRQEIWQWSTLWSLLRYSAAPWAGHIFFPIQKSFPWLSGTGASVERGLLAPQRLFCATWVWVIYKHLRDAWLTSAWEKAKQFLNNHCGTCNAINLDPIVF